MEYSNQYTLKSDFANFIKLVPFYHPKQKDLLAYLVDKEIDTIPYDLSTSGYDYQKDNMTPGEIWHIFTANLSEDKAEYSARFAHGFYLTIKSGVITAKYKQ